MRFMVHLLELWLIRGFAGPFDVWMKYRCRDGVFAWGYLLHLALGVVVVGRDSEAGQAGDVEKA